MLKFKILSLVVLLMKDRAENEMFTLMEQTDDTGVLSKLLLFMDGVPK